MNRYPFTRHFFSFSLITRSYKTRRVSKPPNFWNDKGNIINFLSILKEKLNLQSFDDWNGITYKQIQLNGGNTLLKKYSLHEIKKIGFPEGNFNKTKLSSYKPNGYWNIEENKLEFLHKLKEKLNLNTFDDWNSVTIKQIRSNGGNTLLKKYSLHDIKSIGFPEGNFQKSNISIKPSGFWNKKENVLEFLDDLKNKYNLNTVADWNEISSSQIRSNGGGRLLQKYSLYELKNMGFPNGKFEKPILSFKPNGFWNKKENILKFLYDLKNKYNLNTADDWNSISRKLILSNGGSSLLSKYSLYKIKCLGFPEGKDIFKKMQSKPLGYWDNKQNITFFLHELSNKLNLNTFECWDLLSRKEILDNGGGSLLSKFSLYEIKCMAFPEGKFEKPVQYKPFGYWEIQENRIQFFEMLKSKFDLNTPQDWRRLSKNQIISNGGAWLFKKKKYLEQSKLSFTMNNDSSEQISFSLQELLRYDPKIDGNSSSKRSSQRWLFLQIQKLFPHEEIIEDYFHSEISRDTGSTIQFDIFLIERNIAVEYHGEQHYEDIPSGFAPLSMYKKRDEEKKNICKKYGIQLIIIPYWWNNKLNSLKEKFAHQNL